MTNKLSVETNNITPSRKDQISEKLERQLRAFGCLLIKKVCLILELPHRTPATAQVIFHKFYQMKSLKQIEVKIIALSSVFLSCKLEETPRRVRHIINTFVSIDQIEQKQKQVPINPLNQEYWEIKNEIIQGESYILNQIGFDLQIEHPFKFLLNYSNTLKCSPKLIQKAWNFLNDCFMIDVCIKYPSPLLAVSCLFISSEILGETIFEKQNLSNWNLFNTTIEDITKVSQEILSLYKDPKPQYVDLSEEN
ncbi:hypothetical protein M0813_02230 [Anaeramoeba flamelloides]|uniref:Cyclin-like domain-containing protein n=2 Tax=Anaeramoeba flamelloides TaxID=1746091 RepID=A0ABQ8YRA8_9EUKA|nr:hypothetical protein M0813_02230 [Anaeramoeba flamelloides]